MDRAFSADHSRIHRARATAATNNTKATFGFVASATVQTDGKTLGDFQGELSYNDHGFGLKLHSVSVTSVSVNSVNHTATFSGMADVDAPSGSGTHSFTVTVKVRRRAVDE